MSIIIKQALLTTFFLAIIWADLFAQTETGLFDKSIAEINKNIDNEQFSANLDLYQNLVRTKSLNQFSCTQKGKLLHRFGLSSYLNNSEYEAIEFFQLALNSWGEDCPNVKNLEKANTQFNIGVCYQYTPEIHLGGYYIDQAILQFENDTTYDSINLAYKYQGAGNYYNDINEIVRAKTYFLNALNILENHPEEAEELFFIYNRLLILHMDIKKYDDAQSYFLKALALNQQFDQLITDEDLAFIYLNGAIIYLESKEYEKAVEYAENGLSLVSESSNPEIYANAHEILGLVHHEQRTLDQALKYFEKVIELREKDQGLHSYQNKSIGLQNMSELLIDMNERAGAMDAVNQALRYLTNYTQTDQELNPILGTWMIPDKILLIKSLEIKSKVIETNSKESLQDRLDLILPIYEKIDTIIEQGIKDYVFENSKIEFYELIESQYNNYIKHLLAGYEISQNEGFLIRAQMISSKSKAIVLQNRLNQTTTINLIEDPEILARRAQLDQVYSDILNEINLSENAPDSLMQKFAKIQLEQSIFYDQLEEKQPEYYRQKTKHLNAPRIPKIQNNLTKDQAIIDYYYMPEQIIGFWITKDNYFYQTIILNEKFKNSLNLISSQCRDPSQSISKESSKYLYSQLLGGVGKIEPGINRLVILPDGPLHNLSFGALVFEEEGQEKFLIEKYALSHHYTTALLFKENEPIRHPKFLGFGTTYSSGLNQQLVSKNILNEDVNLTSLNLTTSEIERGQELFKGGSYLNDKATMQNFLDQVEDSDIIYLSLHGLVDTEDPSRSCIVFDNREEPFLLTPPSLQAIPLVSQLVILSSCHTASGKLYLGEGINGMSRAFISAGVDRVVSSLWSASERSSSIILGEFLTNLKGRKFSDQSLQKAKIDYLHSASPSQRHPFYWSNYILIGSSQPIVKSIISPIALITLALVIGCLLFLFWYRK